jgi:hypothetical protein
MTYTIRAFALSAISAAFLAGCASSSDQYPSLAVRDAERQTGQFTVATPDTAPVQSAASAPETFTQLRGFVEQARSAHQQFVAVGTDAAQLVRGARGVRIDDDRRARALVAIARLTTLHGQTTLAMSDLDQLEFQAAAAFDATEDINAAQILVGQMIRDQEAALDSLSAKLAS